MSWLDQGILRGFVEADDDHPDQALPGRTTRWPWLPRMWCSATPMRGDDPESAAGIGEFSGRHAVVLAGGCFWGVEDLLAGPRRVHHGRRLCRWIHAQPEL